MAFLKGLFKKKEGGTMAGNLFRKVTSSLADKVGLGFAVDAINPIPSAPVKVQKAAATALTFVAELPAQNALTAQTFASQAAAQVIRAGGTEAEAQTVASKVEEVAQEPAKVVAPPAPKVSVSLADLDGMLAAQKALGTTLAETPGAVAQIAKSRGTTKTDILAILKDGGLAAKDAMVQSWLDKTESGKDTKAAAIWGQVETYAPYGVALIGGVWFAKRQGWIK